METWTLGAPNTADAQRIKLAIMAFHMITFACKQSTVWARPFRTRHGSSITRPSLRCAPREVLGTFRSSFELLPDLLDDEEPQSRSPWRRRSRFLTTNRHRLSGSDD